MFDFDNFLEWIMKTIIVGFILILVFGIGAITIDYFIYEPRDFVKIEAMGYKKCDVKVFLNDTGLSRQEFIDSEFVRQQFEIFKSGKTSEFIESARHRKTENDKSTKYSNAAVISAALISGAMRGGK